ncbi:MAG: apolipoprotein N-acyltransferase, partial [Thermodesulfovibrionales bacterium]|nr:apolipoprotein N-acyltransferase [Thermodesulfovibrionales bacterium]
IPYFYGTDYWIYYSVHHYGGVPFVPSLLIVLLLSLYLSLYTGFFALLFSMKIKSTRLPALLLAPLVWVSLEFARSYAITGFPWSSIGYSQYRFLHMIQFADITGIYGVSFLLLAINGALADIYILKKREMEMPLFSPTPTAAGYGVLILTLIGAFAYGSYRLAETRPGENVKVSIIQGSIEQDVKWEPSYRKKAMDIHTSLTNSVAAARPSLIVWPETAAPFYFERDKELTSGLMEFSKTLDAFLLLGAITVKDGDGTGGLRHANSAVLLDREGKVGYVYDKIHLVPFGEYVPLRPVLFFVNRLAEGIGEFVPGEKYIRAETPFGSFGTPICYEIIFPGLVRKFYQKGGDFIVTITNDAWFGTTSGPYQHWSMAVMRAVENRKPVVRAANTGISGFIDSSGRIIKQTKLFERVALTADIRTDRTRTFYSKYGDLFSFFAIVITLLILMDLKRDR